MEEVAMQILGKITDNLKTYYDQCASLDDESQKVGWKNRPAQLVRFEQLAKIIRHGESNFSINDIGCGLGDFYPFLQRKGFGQFTYHGFDMMEAMVSQASDRFRQDENCTFSLVSCNSEIPEADYSIASGIFNLSYNMSEEEWLEYQLATLEAINDKSRLGFAFNCLTSYSDTEYKRPELTYSDPCYLFNYCKQNFSRNIALLHDYKEYDFTILVRKYPG